MPGVDIVDLLVEVERAERRWHSDKADELFARLLPLLVFEIQSIDHYTPAPSMFCAGEEFDIDPSLRAPGLRSLSAASTQRLDSYLKRLALLDGAEIRTSPLRTIAELVGRRALVTGSSRGIGLACARALIERGAAWHPADRARPRRAPPDVLIDNWTQSTEQRTGGQARHV